MPCDAISFRRHTSQVRHYRGELHHGQTGKLRTGRRRGVAAVLFTNSHHDSEWPETIFDAALKTFGCGVSSLVEHLLRIRYQKACGHHRQGDRMFSVDLAPGDREVVMRVDFATDPRLSRDTRV